MNYMKDVAKLLGVEIGEEFKVKLENIKENNGVNISEEKFRFNEQGLECDNCYVYTAEILKGLITGVVSVIKLPKYVLNVYTELSPYMANYYIVNSNGNAKEYKCAYEKCAKQQFIYSNLFKDEQSAKTYIELRKELKEKSRPFVRGKQNYYMFIDEYNDIQFSIAVNIESQGDFFETEEDCQHFIDKYGEEVLKNYIRYCK